MGLVNTNQHVWMVNVDLDTKPIFISGTIDKSWKILINKKRSWFWSDFLLLIVKKVKRVCEEVTTTRERIMQGERWKYKTCQ